MITHSSQTETLLYFFLLSCFQRIFQNGDFSRSNVYKTKHPSLFDRANRKEILNREDLLWYIQGYYGFQGFEVTKYDVYKNSDNDFLPQHFGKFDLSPPQCTDIETEINHPPEIAFWQALIIHFTYFAPTPKSTIINKGWGTFEHTQKSLLKEFKDNETIFHAVIETETLGFIPQICIECIANTKVYTEGFEHIIDSNSIDQWFVDNGYRNSHIKNHNDRYSNEFIFAQTHFDEYQLTLYFVDTFGDGDLERLSQIELICISDKPIYAKDLKEFKLVQHKEKKGVENWNYQVLHTPNQ